jgi:hypothetical protein
MYIRQWSENAVPNSVARLEHTHCPPRRTFVRSADNGHQHNPDTLPWTCPVFFCTCQTYTARIPRCTHASASRLSANIPKQTIEFRCVYLFTCIHHVSHLDTWRNVHTLCSRPCLHCRYQRVTWSTVDTIGGKENPSSAGKPRSSQALELAGVLPLNPPLSLRRRLRFRELFRLEDSTGTQEQSQCSYRADTEPVEICECSC